MKCNTCHERHTHYHIVMLAACSFQTLKHYHKAEKCYKLTEQFEISPGSAEYCFRFKYSYIRFLLFCERYTEAMKVLDSAFLIRQQYFPKQEYLFIYSAVIAKSCLLIELKQFKESLKFATIALKGFRKLSNRHANHPDVSSCLANLACAHTKLGNFKQAIRQGKKWNSYIMKNAPHDVYNIAHSHFTLGMAYLFSGKFDKALEHYKEALVTWRTVLDDSSPAVINCLNIIQSCLNAAQRVETDPTFSFEEWRKTKHEKFKLADNMSVNTGLSNKTTRASVNGFGTLNIQWIFIITALFAAVCTYYFI